MSRYPARIITILLASLAGASLGGCAVYDGPYRGGYMYTSPPAGFAYFDYWYYPGVQVYYDIHRHVYFYLGSGGWIQTRVLPPPLKARLGNHVPIHSRYDRPYMEHNDHRRRYPQNYYQPPQKKAPEQYRYEPRRDYENTRRYERQRYDENLQRNDRRERQQYPQAPVKKAPVKKAPANDKKRSYGKDKKQERQKEKQSNHRQDRKEQGDQDRDRRDYR